ncbi:MAG: tetratricopeptide repeat protein, partial [Verrucomicrobiales bacterium]|nr:tetratricopeptide repeat protein [Verrucomicrobiales bacterium]
AEGRFEDALPWFEKGLLIDAKNWDILANFSYTLSRLGRSSEAADRISTAFKDGLEKKPDRVLFLARTLADADRRSEARALYEQALRSNQLSEEGLLSYIGLLGNADDWNTALDALRAAQKNRPSLRLQRWEGSVLSRLERYPEALAHLEKLHQAHPDDVEITEDLASVHLDAGQWREALDLVEPVLKQPVHTNNVSFLALKARAQHGLGWTRQASSTVDAALKDNPENPTLQQLRQLIGSAVGQGNPEWLRTPFEAVPLSDANRDWILADAPAQPAQDSESSWFDYRITSVHFEPGKPRRRTIRYRARIFDQAGVREFSTLQFTFHPPWERFHAHRIQVKDATTGVVIATGSIDDAFVSNPSQGAVVTEERLISIPVPGLRPGTLLEAEVTIGTADPVRDFDFINEILTGSTPSAARGLVVTGKIDRLRHLCADTVTAARRGDALCWRVTAPARMLPEPLSPAPEKFAPTVWISDSDEGADWKTVAQGFLKDIQNRLKPDPEAATWVASLKLPTDLPPAERIQRIVERLRRDINYQGLEFGPHSRMPHPPSKVLKDRYGDCKDQSLLLLQALAASDIPAHLTLVGSTNPIRDALPSLDQFDHMVVHVPGSGAEPFIDPTQRDGMLRLPVPSGLDDRHLLILDPENPRLHRTKAYPADMGELRIERQVRPLEDGRLHVSETLFTSDYWAETLRGSLRDTDPVYRREWIENVASDAAQGAVEVGKIDITPLQNPDQPLKLVSEWDSPVAIDSDAAQMRVLWPSWEAYFLPPNGSTLRYNPLELRYALRMDSRTTLHAPSGSVWDVGPGEKVFNGKFGTGKLSWAPGKNTTELVLDLHFERPTGYHPKDAYTAFRREMEAVIQTLRRQPWKLRPAPASAAPGL